MPEPGAPPTTHAGRGRTLLAFAALYLIWGSTYLAIRYAVETIPPFLMASTRFFIAGAILYLWARRRSGERPTPAMWRDAAVTGILLLCGGNGAVVWAEQRLPSGLTALIVAVVPVWIVVADWLRPDGKRPTGRVVAGLVLGLAGLVMLIGFDSLRGDGDRVDLVASLVLVGGSIAWAIGSIYNRHGHNPRSAQQATGMQMLGGSVALLLMAVVNGDFGALRFDAISAASAAGWLYLIFFGGIVGFTAYVYLLRVTTPAKASTYAYVNPLVALVLGWAVAGESIGMRSLLAAVVTLAGVALITSDA